jgi:hypothetical protein
LPKHRELVNGNVHIDIKILANARFRVMISKCPFGYWSIKMASHKAAPPADVLDILIGARALAQFIYGSEQRWRSVYPRKNDLGLFRWRGTICGRRSTIKARLAALEKRGLNAA